MHKVLENLQMGRWLCAFASLWMCALNLLAGPLEVTYKGRLTDQFGKPVAGPVNLTLKFYANATTNAPLGIYSFKNVSLKDGLFEVNVILQAEDSGSDPSKVNKIFADSESTTFVEVSDTTNARLYPRQKFSSVPYALKVPVDRESIVYSENGALSLGKFSSIAIKTANNTITTLRVDASSAANVTLTLPGNNPTGTQTLQTDNAGNLSWVNAAALKGPNGDRGNVGPTGVQGTKGIKGDAGAVGPQGPAGDQGGVGATGPQGAIGLKGSKGDVGDKGAQGSPGLKGDKGDTGTTGAVGTKGPKGDGGTQGPSGLVGSAGLKGVKGDKGGDGTVGPIGSKGPDGQIGQAGPSGVKGEKGDKGGIGTAGPQGPAGAAGPKGVAGESGSEGIGGLVGLKGQKGDEGAKGVKGDVGSIGGKGDKGDIGSKGPQGDQGAPGVSRFISSCKTEFRTDFNTRLNEAGQLVYAKSESLNVCLTANMKAVKCSIPFSKSASGPIEYYLETGSECVLDNPPFFTNYFVAHDRIQTSQKAPIRLVCCR